MTEPDVSQSLPIAPYESDDTTPSSPEAEAVYDVKPAGDASDVLIDMPQTYSGPLRPGEKSAEVPGRVETSEISEEPTSSILQWSNQDQIDHRDRIAGCDGKKDKHGFSMEDNASLKEYISYFNGIELIPNDGTQNLEREKEDVEASVRRARAGYPLPDSRKTIPLQSLWQTESVSNSKTMPTNNDLLTAVHNMHLSLERLVTTNAEFNERIIDSLMTELRQVDGVPSQEQRGKGRRGGRGKNNRRTPLHYDYGGDAHGSMLAQDYLRERTAGVPYRDGGAPSR